MRNQESTKFKLLIQLKFLFSIFRVILIVCLYNTYEENIFAGLGVMVDREDELFKQASYVSFIGVLVTLICFAIDISIQLSGATFNYNKINIINFILAFFNVILMTYFILQAWHYVTIWYICIVTSFPQALLEIIGVFDACCNTRKYDSIRIKATI